MATKKSAGKARILRDSNPQYLGVKLYDGQAVKKGMIIVRQRGSDVLPGKNTMMGNDDTVFAVADGTVKFSKKRQLKFNNKAIQKKVVSVVTAD